MDSERVIEQPLVTGVGLSAAAEFRMIMEDVYEVKGRGIVATGTIEAGIVVVGSSVASIGTDGSSGLRRCSVSKRSGDSSRRLRRATRSDFSWTNHGGELWRRAMCCALRGGEDGSGADQTVFGAAIWLGVSRFWADDWADPEEQTPEQVAFAVSALLAVFGFVGTPEMSVSRAPAASGSPLGAHA